MHAKSKVRWRCLVREAKRGGYDDVTEKQKTIVGLRFASNIACIGSEKHTIDIEKDRRINRNLDPQCST
jgi:hypothetical protein